MSPEQESLFTETAEKVRQIHALLFPRKTEPAAGLQLGLTENIQAPRSWIYVGENSDPNAGWYKVVDGKQVPITESCIVGTLEQVFGVVRSAPGNKDSYKFCFVMNCGNMTYVIQSGVETQFSKNIVSSLLTLPAETLAEPIGIRVRSGDNAKVKFGSVHEIPSGKLVVGEEHFDTIKSIGEAAIRICGLLGVDWEQKDWRSTGHGNSHSN